MLDLLEAIVGVNPIGKEHMKRIVFLIVATIAGVVANGNAASAQEFPTTGIDSLNGAGSDLITSLPPLPGKSISPGVSESILVSPPKTSAVKATATPASAPNSRPQIFTSPAPQTIQQLPQQQFGVGSQQSIVSLPTAAQPNVIQSNPVFVNQQPQVFTEVSGFQQFAPQTIVSPGQTIVSPGQTIVTNSFPQEGFIIDESHLIQGDIIQGETFIDGGSYFEDQNFGGRRERVSQRRDRRASRPRRSSVYSTAGASALIFDRNFGSNRNFSTNAAGDVLSSNNATNGLIGGVDAFIGRRRASGRGWEARYFGLYPIDTSIQIGNNARNLLPGLNQLGTNISGTGPLARVQGPSAGDLFDRDDTHVLTRQAEINNAEFNFLKCGAPRFRARQTEFLLGFRYFQFGETLLHQGLNVPNGDPNFLGPNSADYLSSVENNLLGIQIGTRSDFQLRRRVTVHLGVKAGAFYNDIDTRQRVDYNQPNGSTTNPRVAGGTLSGQLFDIGASDDVRSVLGEVDASISYQLSESSRIRVGYRAVAITDIAFASDQIRDDFTDATALQSPVADDDLTLQGIHIGLELAY